MTLDELIFFERFPQYLSAYAVFKKKVEARWPDTEIKVEKVKISFKSSRVFTIVSPPYRTFKGRPKEHILFSFELPYCKRSPRIAQASEVFPGRWAHHVVITEKEEIDKELLSWIEEAYEFALNRK